MSNELPKIGSLVTIDDDWFYPGLGIVVRNQTVPHHATLVRITEIHEPNNQHYVGREVWILPGNLEPVE